MPPTTTNIPPRNIQKLQQGNTIYLYVPRPDEPYEFIQKIYGIKECEDGSKMKINATYDQWTCRIPGTTVYITPPRPIFQARYLHSWNSTCSGARKVGAGTSRRELSEDVSFGIDTLFRCRAVELGKSPKGGVIYTVIYLSLIHISEPTRPY